MLYLLFGRDPSTREEAVVEEGVGEDMYLSAPVFVDWTCDYP